MKQTIQTAASPRRSEPDPEPFDASEPFASFHRSANQRVAREVSG